MYSNSEGEEQKKEVSAGAKRNNASEIGLAASSQPPLPEAIRVSTAPLPPAPLGTLEWRSRCDCSTTLLPQLQQQRYQSTDGVSLALIHGGQLRGFAVTHKYQSQVSGGVNPIVEVPSN